MGELHLEVIGPVAAFKVQANVGNRRWPTRDDQWPGGSKDALSARPAEESGHVVIEAIGGPGRVFFTNEIIGGAIPKEFIPAVESGLREAMHNGVLAGYPVTDVEVKLMDGSYHPVDSSELALKLPLPGIEKALAQAQPVLPSRS